MRPTLRITLFLTLVSFAVGQQPDQPEAAPEPEPTVPSKLLLTVGQSGHSAGIVHVEFTRDGKKLLTVGLDNTIRVWDVATGEHLRAVRLPWREGRDGDLIGFVGPDSVLSISADGRVVAVASQTKAYHTARGMNSAGMEKRFEHQVSLIHLESGLIKPLPGAQGTIQLLSFSPDGDMLAAAGKAVHWSGGTGKTFSEWTGGKSWLWSGLQKAWKPDAPGPALVRAYGHRLHPGAHVENTGWSPDSKTLVECWFQPHLEKKAARALAVPLAWWDAKSGDTTPKDFPGMSGKKTGKKAKAKEAQENPHGALRSVAWAPGGGWLAAADSDDSVHVWAPDGLRLRTFKVGAALLAPPVFRTDNEMVFAGKQTGEAPGGTVSRFDPSNLKVDQPEAFLRFPLPDTLHQLTVAATGDRLAILAGSSSTEVTLLGFQPDARPQPLAVTVAPTPFVAFSKTGLKLAWTGPDQTKLVAAVDLQTAEPVPPEGLIPDEFGTPAARARSASGEYEAEPRFARGGLIDLYRPVAEKAKKGQPTRRLVFTAFASGQDWVITTPEGYYAASPGGERLVGWHANNGLGALASFYPLDRFRKKLYRPDVIRVVVQRNLSVAQALKVANALGGTDAVAVEDLLPPRCRIDLVSQDKGSVTLRVRATAQAKGQPVEALKLLLDGRPTGTRGAVVDDGTADKEFPGGKASVDETWTFDLPGEKAVGAYQIAVLARSKDAAAPSNAVAVTFVDPTKVPALHVLAVGINKYAQTALELKFAAKDAAEVADAFQAHAKDGLFSGVHVHKLLDAQATRQGVLDAVAAVRKVAKRNDLCVVFFAGHGAKAKEQFYLLTVEADVKALESSALSGADLRKSLGGFPCQVLLMLDACHSAGFGEKGTLKAASLERATDEATRLLTEDDVGVAVMAAAMGHEFALERDGNGLFTRAVLDALGRAEGVPFNRSNQLLYAHHLQAFVFDRVADRSGGRQHPYLNLPWVVQSFPVVRIAAK